MRRGRGRREYVVRDAAPVTPASIFGAALAFWHERDLGVTYGSGTEVSGWADQSGNGNNASQGTAADRPTQATATAPIEFDGTSDRLNVADAATLDPTTSFTLVLRFRPDTLAGTRMWIAKSPATGAGAWWVQYAGELRFGLSATQAGRIPAAAFTAGSWCTVVWIFDGSQATDATRLRGYVDGVQQTLTFFGVIPATMTVDTNTIAIGSTNDGAQFSDEGVNLTVGANTVATAPQLTAITSYATAIT